MLIFYIITLALFVFFLNKMTLKIFLLKIDKSFLKIDLTNS